MLVKAWPVVLREERCPNHYHERVFRITKDPLHRIYQIQGFQKFRKFKESEPNQKQYLGLRLVSDGRK